MPTALLDRGLVPLPLLRAGIRRLLAQRLAACEAAGDAGLEAFLAAKRDGPIARHTDAANAQHYEVPAAFHALTLGPRMKYSGGLWPSLETDLAASETAMLDLSLERAGIADGQRVLDLGCGWGALTIRLLERFPRCEVVAISNSHSQRAHILAEVARRGLRPPTVLTADVNGFAPPGTFDRVMSVEMFEHLWNHEALLARIAGVLRPGGALFLHVFAHRRFAYPFEDRGPADWMARHFFTGGWMPSHDAFARARGPLTVVESHEVDGTHYARTARAWRENLERRRVEALPVLATTYGPGEARRWFHRWRLFFLACEELWAFRGGTEWIVSHHRLEPRRAGA
jgi:cyclopropane-fatty-acyl-phospholipid synthase